jgi:hypothetical protein
MMKLQIELPDHVARFYLGYSESVRMDLREALKTILEAWAESSMEQMEPVELARLLASPAPPIESRRPTS